MGMGELVIAETLNPPYRACARLLIGHQSSSRTGHGKAGGQGARSRRFAPNFKYIRPASLQAQ